MGGCPALHLAPHPDSAMDSQIAICTSCGQLAAYLCGKKMFNVTNQTMYAYITCEIEMDY